MTRSRTASSSISRGAIGADGRGYDVVLRKRPQYGTVLGRAAINMAARSLIYRHDASRSMRDLADWLVWCSMRAITPLSPPKKTYNKPKRIEPPRTLTVEALYKEDR